MILLKRLLNFLSNIIFPPFYLHVNPDPHFWVRSGQQSAKKYIQENTLQIRISKGPGYSPRTQSAIALTMGSSEEFQIQGPTNGHSVS
jgi:hypothetical protein